MRLDYCTTFAAHCLPRKVCIYTVNKAVTNGFTGTVKDIVHNSVSPVPSLKASSRLWAQLASHRVTVTACDLLSRQSPIRHICHNIQNNYHTWQTYTTAEITINPESPLTSIRASVGSLCTAQLHPSSSPAVRAHAPYPATPAVSSARPVSDRAAHGAPARRNGCRIAGPRPGDERHVRAD